MCKADGGYGKVLMRKPAKEPVHKPAPSRKELAESSGAPLRFKRMVKPPIKGQPTGFFSESDDEQLSKGPTLASLSTSNKSVVEPPNLMPPESVRLPLDTKHSRENTKLLGSVGHTLGENPKIHIFPSGSQMRE